jgi:hypothetical protein
MSDQKAENQEKIPDNILWHQSGVNPKGEPFVQLIKGETIIAQMDVEGARDHAMAILESAEAAEQDAFLMFFLQQTLNLPLESAAQVLADYRRFREATTGKKGGPSRPSDWVYPERKP